MAPSHINCAHQIKKGENPEMLNSNMTGSSVYFLVLCGGIKSERGRRGHDLRPPPLRVMCDSPLSGSFRVWPCFWEEASLVWHVLTAYDFLLAWVRHLPCSVWAEEAGERSWGLAQSTDETVAEQWQKWFGICLTQLNRLASFLQHILPDIWH